VNVLNIGGSTSSYVLLGVVETQQPERDASFQELYASRMDENDDIMSLEDAVDTCDRVVEDVNLFS
jgi:hypothetical protein